MFVGEKERDKERDRERKEWMEGERVRMGDIDR